MKQRTHDLITGWIAAAALFVALLLSIDAFAGPPKKPPMSPPTQQQEQHQGQSQYQHQGQEQSQANQQHMQQTIDTAASATGSAWNEGNSLSVESHYESGPADLVLVPNNNTEPCLRVFGLSFGNKEGSGMLGFPWRSRQCDYKGFAAEAAAYGDHETAWFWRCHMRSAYRTFRDKGESIEKAVEDCTERMVGPITLQRRLDAANDQLEFIENERKIEQQNFINQREQAKADCAEALDRQHQTCMEK